ncbi:hypothetical protein CVD28_13735 [Bacillus sp. M6-12]|uniref:hypothetical protein n=1 Tax=Bacillus sp. M6-12 TaxID=2054166 RepID=UPI000C787F8B|nr:hypothetical protein [Bacillus sp. M6-12]PLS17110.1 hypothetical protein CVD28_13735 [Bacillus sp. M6-12]
MLPQLYNIIVYLFIFLLTDQQEKYIPFLLFFTGSYLIISLLKVKGKLKHSFSRPIFAVCQAAAGIFFLPFGLVQAVILTGCFYLLFLEKVFTHKQIALFSCAALIASTFLNMSFPDMAEIIVFLIILAIFVFLESVSAKFAIQKIGFLALTCLLAVMATFAAPYLVKFIQHAIGFVLAVLGWIIGPIMEFMLTIFTKRTSSQGGELINKHIENQFEDIQFSEGNGSFYYFAAIAISVLLVYIVRKFRVKRREQNLDGIAAPLPAGVFISHSFQEHKRNLLSPKDPIRKIVFKTEKKLNSANARLKGEPFSDWVDRLSAAADSQTADLLKSMYHEVRYSKNEKSKEEIALFQREMATLVNKVKQKSSEMKRNNADRMD